MNTWEIIDKISESELTTDLKLEIPNSNTDTAYDKTPDSINKIINVDWALTPEFSSSDSETENSLLIKNPDTNINTNCSPSNIGNYQNNTVIDIHDIMYQDRIPDPDNPNILIRTLVVSCFIIAGFYIYKTF